MEGKKKGPAARKLTGPKHKTEVKRLLKSKIKELESQETQFLFLFVESQQDVVSELMLDAIWKFMVWLRKNDYIILDAKKMVRPSLEID
ncbi:hypothetical protein ES703_123431 [subsurface metagenome]|nr:hypothetical protein [bacterium]